MKTILTIVSLIFMGLGQTALACPGGEFKILQIEDRQIGLVDMNENTVSVTDDNSELYQVYWNWSDQATTAIAVCGGPSEVANKCDSSGHHVGFKLTDAPNTHLYVKVKVDGVEKEFVVTNFSVARGGGGCGTVVNPE